MSARQRKEKDDSAASAPPAPEVTSSLSDDEIEILEVVGFNETEPTGAVILPDTMPEPKTEAQLADTGEIEAARQERDQYHDRLVRLQADFDNFRKRAGRDSERQRTSATADLMRHLLPVLDNLDRALRTCSGDDSMRRGVELIHQQMIDLLAKEGLQPVPAVGEPFDPHLHEAVDVIDSPGVEPGMVLEEMQRGYRYKDRLIRPSLVKVAASHDQTAGAAKAAAG